MPRRATVPAVLSSGPFRGSAAVAAGVVTRRQLQSRSYRRVFRDVYAPAEGVGTNHVDRCRALALVLPARAVFSGLSAAALRAVPGIGDLVPVTVTVPRDRPWGPMAGVRIDRSALSPDEVQTVDRLAVTEWSRTLWDVARMPDGPDAVAVLDAVVREFPVLDRRLPTVAERYRTRPGGLRAATNLALVDGRAESPMESRLRVLLVTAGLPTPVPQHRVFDRSGRFVARLDLAWPDRQVAVEYDGRWHGAPAQFDRDRRRLNALVAARWTVVHVTAPVVGDIGPLVRQIRDALDR
jgi:hypothetical protein